MFVARNKSHIKVESGKVKMKGSAIEIIHLNLTCKSVVRVRVYCALSTDRRINCGNLEFIFMQWAKQLFPVLFERPTLACPRVQSLAAHVDLIPVHSFSVST